MMMWLIGGAVFTCVGFGWLWYEVKRAPLVKENDDER